MATDNQYKNDSKYYKVMNFSVILFIVVIIGTLVLYFYNLKLESKISQMEKNISSKEEDIKKINSDEMIKLYILCNSNKKFLDKYAYLSKIPDFINALKNISRKYKIDIEGFSYSNGQITTQALVGNESSNTYSFAFEKTKEFLKFFREKNDHIFSLGFINYFDGQDNIKFGINFQVILPQNEIGKKIK